MQIKYVEFLIFYRQSMKVRRRHKFLYSSFYSSRSDIIKLLILNTYKIMSNDYIISHLRMKAVKRVWIVWRTVL